MEICCSFESLVADGCGFDRKDRKRDMCIVPLLSCNKDVTGHMNSFSFTGIRSEYELILTRATLFEQPKDIETWTICPHHRSKLGLGWTRGGNTRCRVPAIISNHRTSKSKLPKADRGMGKLESQLIFLKTGYLIPVGSGNYLIMYDFYFLFSFCYLITGN